MNSRPPFEAHRRTWTRSFACLQDTPAIDREYIAPLEEFQARVRRTNQALQHHGHTVGLVFSDEHYAGDVPYLGGNTNISIEQVAGVIGPNGFHVVAGLEGGYVAEQLASRAGATVHKVELLQLADEKYPIRAERLEDVIRAAAGKDVDHIALLTPRQVIPAGLVEYLQNIYGREGVVDAQELYFRVKYEKSEIEMRLIADACIVADAMLRAMLAVLRPGRLETEVAAWGAWVGRMLGSERDGFQIMVGANTANRTLIGPALNRHIQRRRLGSPRRRAETRWPDSLPPPLRYRRRFPQGSDSRPKYWFDLVEEGYSRRALVSGSRRQKLPARLQEQSLVDFFAGHSEEISRRIGKKIDLAQQKPYTGTHNSGYTECQEFFGAITLDSHDPLGNQIVTMLDVALRGIGDRWNDVVIPGFDFCVVENTLGKYGTRVETLTKVPTNVQELVAS